MIMKTIRSIATAAALAIAAALASQTAQAQSLIDSHPSNSANPAGAEPIAGDSVYKAFHEQAGIQRIIDDFIIQVTTDPRIKASFATTDLKNLDRLLVEQVVYLTGGGGTYTGRDMKTAHAQMGLEKVDFNALAEDLQLSMDKEKVAFAAQNRLLAKLAPMERVIVTK
jgi:hemoglobin